MLERSGKPRPPSSLSARKARPTLPPRFPDREALGPGPQLRDEWLQRLGLRAARRRDPLWLQPPRSSTQTGRCEHGFYRDSSDFGSDGSAEGTSRVAGCHGPSRSRWEWSRHWTARAQPTQTTAPIKGKCHFLCTVIYRAENVPSRCRRGRKVCYNVSFRHPLAVYRPPARHLSDETQR